MKILKILKNKANILILKFFEFIEIIKPRIKDTKYIIIGKKSNNPLNFLNTVKKYFPLNSPKKPISDIFRNDDR